MQLCPDCLQGLTRNDKCCCGWKAFSECELDEHGDYLYSKRRYPFYEDNFEDGQSLQVDWRRNLFPEEYQIKKNRSEGVNVIRIKKKRKKQYA